MKVIQVGGQGHAEITDEFEISPVSVLRSVKWVALDMALHQATA